VNGGRLSSTAAKATCIVLGLPSHTGISDRHQVEREDCPLVVQAVEAGGFVDHADARVVGQADVPRGGQAVEEGALEVVAHPDPREARVADVSHGTAVRVVQQLLGHRVLGVELVGQA